MRQLRILTMEYTGNWMIDGDDGSHYMSPKYVPDPHEEAQEECRCIWCGEHYILADDDHVADTCQECRAYDDYCRHDLKKNKELKAKTNPKLHTAKMKTTYFLFGGMALDMYQEFRGTAKEFAQEIKDSGTCYMVYKFVDGESDPSDLLYNFNGYGDYTEIHENFYNQLVK